MKTSALLTAFFAPAAFLSAGAQNFEALHSLQGFRTAVYYSEGSEAKARRMAGQVDRVTAFYQQEFSFLPEFSLLILSPEDWSKYTRFPVYGMPHYTDARILVVASEDNAFWKGFIPPTGMLTAEQAGLIRKAYGKADGSLSMEPFFDLLAIHELGHAYQLQYGLQVQRKWMGELFVNLFLHTYIAENEPQLLDALTVFPHMVLATTQRTGLEFTTLPQLEANYDSIAMHHPANYGWYQCRWHSAAAGIYDAGGKETIKRLWTRLKATQELMPDEKLASFLAAQIHPAVADVLLKWDQ